MYRVIQWATGGVGKAAIQDVLRHPPELELVGCWVHSADKHGRDVGEVIGEARSGGWRPRPISTNCSRWTPTASCTPRCCPTTMSSPGSCAPARMW